MDEDKMMQLMKQMYFETYNTGWKAAVEHYKKQLLKNILSDGVISTNVDVDHLERIVKILEETE